MENLWLVQAHVRRLRTNIMSSFQTYEIPAFILPGDILGITSEEQARETAVDLILTINSSIEPGNITLLVERLDVHEAMLDSTLAGTPAVAS